MGIAIGQHIGSYEITALLGKGGMGEVYRARDTRLERDVAIKTLPEEFETDADRLTRFDHEAKVLASLNHPNIGAIYGIEKHDARHLLVLELVEGETLADLIAHDPIPVDESLKLAQQIAEALQAAHEKGVIHRDLKPANIKITADGTVKVLDFGLAKASDAESSDRDVLSNSPTLRTLASSPGMIVGTAAYMSPEQAKGKPVDRRTDIFAFGCVLYEMLTGKRAFEGDDVSDTLAAVLRAEPDWSLLPTDVPSGLRTLIQRCLAKDRAKRVAEISSLKFVLSEPVFVGSANDLYMTSVSAPSRSRLKKGLFILAFMLSLALAGTLVWTLRKPASIPRVVRFSIRLPEGQTFSNIRNANIAISRDGTQIVYAANGRLYRQSFSDFDATGIPGSEGKIGNLHDPQFSIDGQSIMFVDDQTIKRIAVNGGTPLQIGEAPAARSSLNWSPDGIALSQAANGIFRISPNGGAREPLVTLKDEAAFDPQLLPGGQAVLFTLTKGMGDDRFEDAKVVVQSLKTGERKALVEGSGGRYLPTGHLIYAVGGTVFAVPFNLKTYEVSGEAVQVLEGIRRRAATGGIQLSVSDTGTLIYIAGPATFAGAARLLIITDRNGSTTPLPLPPGRYVHPRISRDGKHVAVAIDDGRDAFVSIYELSTTSALRRLTFEGHNRFPVWSGDGQWIAFQSDREGDLGVFRQRADGSNPAVERLTKPEPGVSHIPESWSPDGKTLLFSARKEERNYSLWALSLETKKLTAFGNIRSRNPIGATFSPDGNWLAYSSVNGSEGRNNPDNGIYVEPFPPTGARYQLPKEYFDFHPAWGATAAELFYVPTASALSAIPVQTQPNFSFGKAARFPRPLTRDRINADFRDYDVMPDSRFVSSVPAGDESVSAGCPSADPCCAQLVY